MVSCVQLYTIVERQANKLRVSEETLCTTLYIILQHTSKIQQFSWIKLEQKSSSLLVSKSNSTRRLKGRERCRKCLQTTPSAYRYYIYVCQYIHKLQYSTLSVLDQRTSATANLQKFCTSKFRHQAVRSKLRMITPHNCYQCMKYEQDMSPTLRLTVALHNSTHSNKKVSVLFGEPGGKDGNTSLQELINLGKTHLPSWRPKLYM